MAAAHSFLYNEKSLTLRGGAPVIGGSDAGNCITR